MVNPISFEQQMMTNYFNLQPSVVKGSANVGTEYEKRYLYNLIYAVYKFKLPKDWALNFFRFWLFQFGSIAVIYTREYGWISQPYSVKRLNLYYQPKVIEVYNSFIGKPKEGVVGVNCGIINIMDDFYSLDDIVTRYATKLANIDKSFNINLMNCNTTMLFEASNKKDADAIKEAYAEATQGKPLVVVNKEVLSDKKISTLLPNPSQTYIGDKLIQARRSVINEFLTTIGIKNANYDKRERLNSQEVNQNNDETSAIVSVIYDNIKSSMDAINKISGLNLDVELRFNYDTEGTPCLDLP